MSCAAAGHTPREAPVWQNTGTYWWDGRRVGLHRPASANTTTRSDHARDRLRPLPGSTTSSHHHWRCAARAAANIATREGRSSGQAGPATEAFAARVDADEMIRQAEADCAGRSNRRRSSTSPELPSWPVDVPLPAWVADHVTDTAARLQVPVDPLRPARRQRPPYRSPADATISAGHWQDPPLPVVRHALRRRQSPPRGDDRPLRSAGKDRQAARADGDALDVARWKAQKS